MMAATSVSPSDTTTSWACKRPSRAAILTSSWSCSVHSGGDKSQNRGAVVHQLLGYIAMTAAVCVHLNK